MDVVVAEDQQATTRRGAKPRRQIQIGEPEHVGDIPEAQHQVTGIDRSLPLIEHPVAQHPDILSPPPGQSVRRGVPQVQVRPEPDPLGGVVNDLDVPAGSEHRLEERFTIHADMRYRTAVPLAQSGCTPASQLFRAHHGPVSSIFTGNNTEPMNIEDLRDLWEADLELDGSEGAPIRIITSPPEKTWIWSDLHFADRGVVEAFDRPFPDVDRMNHHLVREWRRQVRADDTIICLGDVGHPDAWRDRRLMLDILDCPGERVLVLGNHDRDRAALHQIGFTTQYTLALCATDPPLALSHIPLRGIPPTAVNVHGHLHEGTKPTARHINVAVERIDYSPVGLTRVLHEARRR